VEGCFTSIKAALASVVMKKDRYRSAATRPRAKTAAAAPV